MAITVRADEFPTYVGRVTCVHCHGSKLDIPTCSQETVAVHDQSYSALTTPEAASIAYLCGVVEPPNESLTCLGCHAASADVGPRWTSESFDIACGVQCEACHGAGSLHVAGRVARNQNSTPAVDLNIRRSDISDCAACHVRLPSHVEVLEHGYRRNPADQRYKTPVNLAVSPDGRTLFVVCQQVNSVAIVDAESGTVVDEITVGLRPWGIALHPDGDTLFVSNRMSDTLTVIDTTTRRNIADIATGHDPHGVVLDTSARRVYVANTGEDTVSVIDLSQLTEVSRLVTGRGPWDVVQAESGDSILVTNVRPNPTGFRSPPLSEITVVSTSANAVDSRLAINDANMLHGIDVISQSGVTVFALMRAKNLVPITRLAQGWTMTHGLGVIWPDGRTDQVLLDEPDAAFADPMDVASSPDGRHLLVTSGGTDQVALVDVARLLETIQGATDADRSTVLPNHLGMSRKFIVKHIPVGRNPRGVEFSPDGRWAYVVNSLDDSVSVIETERFSVVRTISLGGPDEETEVRRGERIFHSARQTYGQQFSCHSCHPDGHVDGLTFDIEADGIGMSPVDNRSLRGIMDTAPFKWEGTNPSLNRQCGARFAVFFTRLDPYTPSELDALVRYITTIERPLNRYRNANGLTDAQRRGMAVFERVVTNEGEPIPASQRCTTCHNTTMKTSRTTSSVGTTMWFDKRVDFDLPAFDDLEAFGDLGIVYFFEVRRQMKAFDVPQLNNVCDSPPFLHNGSAATLEEIWTRFNLYQSHGLTQDLTRRQFNDLITYLKSL
ncbi:MAG: beta-propeller fold lactonase family protein [Phycisphaerales bacterium]|nr:beta-propeller fold lactonase family protein [Phycisphaerales bacterium]MCB9854189.1 beta-propeller fold lactonase family protein [Phycisphaerales bacterium]